MATQHQLVKRPRRFARTMATEKKRFLFARLLLHLRQARTHVREKAGGTAHVVPFCASTENDLTAPHCKATDATAGVVHMRTGTPAYLCVLRPHGSRDRAAGRTTVAHMTPRTLLPSKGKKNPNSQEENGSGCPPEVFEFRSDSLDL
jgi:hypothetical protein